MTCQFVVVRAGDVTRGEVMNVAVFGWDIEGGVNPLIQMRILSNWDRLRVAFGWNNDELRNVIVHHLGTLKTLDEYKYTVSRMGPYTPFEFTEPRASLDTLAGTLDYVAGFFLREPV